MIVRSRLVVIALGVALVLALAGCASGGPGGEAAATTAADSLPPTTAADSLPPTTAAEASPTSNPAVGDVLRSFVEAAGAADVDSMWALLSEQSREQLGPTEDDFSRRYGQGFVNGLGSFAGTGYDLVVSAEVTGGWGVAAVAGERTRRSKPEYAAYGAALREEGGRWRLVLGEPVEIAGVAPARTTQDPKPRVAVRIRADAAIDEAGLWLDGSGLPATVRGSDGRDITIEGTPGAALSPGWHVVVAFGRAGDVASAGATPFRVDAEAVEGTVA